MIFSAETAAAFQAERPRAATVYNAADARILLFALEPGQQVAPHANHRTTVILTVLSGHGHMTIGDERHPVSAGTTAVCDRGVQHGFEAAERMVVQAVLAPSPQA